MKLKKMIFLTLLGVLMMMFVACDNDSTTEFENNFPQSDMSYYDIDDDHRFYEVTMYEALQLQDDETFNGILYFGFAGCPWCQVAVPFIHEISQEAGVDIFYVSRAHVLREGEWLDWDLEMAWWLYNNGVPNMRWLDEEGALVDVGEEDAYGYRPNINVPQIVHIRNGVIVDSHRGTFEGHDHVGEGDDRHLPEMTDQEQQTLLDIYRRIFSGPTTTEACGIEIDAGCS